MTEVHGGSKDRELVEKITALGVAAGRDFLIVDGDGVVVGQSPAAAALDVVASGQEGPRPGDLVVSRVWSYMAWRVGQPEHVADGLSVMLFEPARRQRTRVQLLGGFEVVGPDGQVFAAGTERTKPWEALLLLCAHGHKPLTRAELAQQMWPYDLPSSQQGKIKEVLARLRSVYGELTGAGDQLWLEPAPGMLQINPQEVEFDIVDGVMAALQTVSDLGATGRVRQAGALAASVFAFLIDSTRPWDPEDAHAPALLGLAERYADAIEQLVFTAVAHVRSEARRRDRDASLVVLELIRRAYWQANWSERMQVTMTEMTLFAAGSPLAKSVYEYGYVPVADSPVTWDELVMRMNGPRESHAR